MPVVTEEIELPTSVDATSVSTAIQLWGTEGIIGYDTSAVKSIGGTTVAGGNPWSATLVGNGDIETPTGTVYRLSTTWLGQRRPFVRFITVPTTGGPYRVDQILTDAPDALPTLTPANQLDSVTLTTPTSALTVGVFTMAAVPGLTLVVPNVAYKTRLWGQMALRHSVTSSSLAVMFAPPSSGIGAQTHVHWDQSGASPTIVRTAVFNRIIAANSPQTVQVYVYSLTTGTITGDFSATQPGVLELLTV
ncbi:MAG TPA: hypothetical protein VFV36_09795 [Candidatus Methylomirabilis sp.]|nr:hypothetical protein [Candidatus Methylomirabilis sp.]